VDAKVGESRTGEVEALELGRVLGQLQQHAVALNQIAAHFQRTQTARTVNKLNKIRSAESISWKTINKSEKAAGFVLFFTMRQAEQA
jgi:alpha-D-ribose 1-methylphosphonate 5-triphosphate synthase subunit PhnG